jgi:serine/threonine protein kinase
VVAATEAPDAEVPPGTVVLGRYQIVGKLAQGGMAEVYLARQVGPGGYQKLVVCKRVRPHLSQDEDFVGMFVNEARLAAMINHPNVVQIFDLNDEVGADGRPDYFLAMEYLDGRDMLQVGRACRAHNKAVPFDVTARIIADACAGLEYAHNLKGVDGKSLDLVHRDMSPENLIITFEGQVKVVDFGIAKARDNSIRTQAGQIKGKLGYVAPEAILGKPVDARADIFAVGATLYLFLSGRPAFTGNSPMEIFERSLKPPPSPREVNERVPPVLDEICMRALAQDRDKRYRSAGEVRAALEAYLASTGRPLGAPQLAQFMKILFPADKDPVRQRIDQLLASAPVFEAQKSKGTPRTISVPQVPVVAPSPVPSDEDRTAIVPPERRQDAAASEAPAAVEMPTSPVRIGAASPARPVGGAAPAHLRSVGVSADIPDVSNPRGRMPDATLEAPRPVTGNVQRSVDDGRTQVNAQVGGPRHTVEEPQQLHTMDVLALDDSKLKSELLAALDEPTMGALDISVEEEDPRAALRAARDILDDPSETAIGGMRMEAALASSDPSSPATVQSPLLRSFTGRMPETGETQGTELPPPAYDLSSPGLPRPSTDSGVGPPPMPPVSGVGFSPILPELQDEQPYAVMDPSASNAGIPIWKKIGMAALGALTGMFIIVIVLFLRDELGTVLGR